MSVGSVDLWANHLYGKGELHKILYGESGILDHELKKLEIISPHQHAKIGGFEKMRNDWPDEIPKGKISSYENHHSHLFEMNVAKYMETNFEYKTQYNFRPAYLKKKEIDVFCEKGGKLRKMTTCECKLRFNDSPITLDEVKQFHKKIKLVEKNETIRGHVRFNHWFVSNTQSIESFAKKFADKNKIEIKFAHLSSNWKKRSDWSCN